MFVGQDHIKNEISKSDFMAIMTDETMDIQDKSQMVIILCYEINGKVVESFWVFLIFQILQLQLCLQCYWIS